MFSVVAVFQNDASEVIEEDSDEDLAALAENMRKEKQKEEMKKRKKEEEDMRRREEEMRRKREEEEMRRRREEERKRREEELRRKREEEERKRREEEEMRRKREEELRRKREEELIKRREEEEEENMRLMAEHQQRLAELHHVPQKAEENKEETGENSDRMSHNLDILEADESSPTSPNSRLSYTSQQLLNIRNYIHSINTKYNTLEVFNETDNEDDDLVSFEIIASFLVRDIAANGMFYLLSVCYQNEL